MTLRETQRGYGARTETALYLCDDDRNTVAYIHPVDLSQRGDDGSHMVYTTARRTLARTMAAAPDLLDACKAMEAAATVLHNAEGVASDGCDCKVCSASRALYDATRAARAAIAKATEEPK